MTSLPHPTGIWLPLITPFRDGEIDKISLRRLIRHYVAQPLSGLILAGTTGECLTLDDDELQVLVEVAAAELSLHGRPMPLYLGLSGSDTRKVARALERTRQWPVDGHLITCPYFSRPSQEGLYQHFATLAEATNRPLIVYNIPYRAGVNMSNETMLRLAERPTIVGVKDCSADAMQSFDLIRQKPAGFSVLTGEDAQFYGALAHGADGGILASAHIDTAAWAAIQAKLQAGDQPGALADWRNLVDLPRLLFAEPNPGAIKHWLWRTGLINSPELRLPMTPISGGLAARIDQAATQKAAA